MKPAHFPEANIVIAKDQPQYIPLPAYHDGASATFCWELTDEEIAYLVVHKHLWHTVLTGNGPLQPVLLSVVKPESMGQKTPSHGG
jgi:hypothetical protein